MSHESFVCGPIPNAKIPCIWWMRPKQEYPLGRSFKSMNKRKKVENKGHVKKEKMKGWETEKVKRKKMQWSRERKERGEGET